MSIVYREATIFDLPTLIDFESKELTDVNPDFFSVSGSEYFIRILSGEGVIFLAECADIENLVGFGVLSYNFEENSSALSDLCNMQEVRQVMSCLDGCVVGAKYKGNNIHSELLKLRVKRSLLDGYPWIHATCNPENKASLKNIYALGYPPGIKNHNEDGLELLYFLKNFSKC